MTEDDVDAYFGETRSLLNEVLFIQPMMRGICLNFVRNQTEDDSKPRREPTESEAKGLRASLASQFSILRVFVQRCVNGPNTRGINFAVVDGVAATRNTISVVRTVRKLVTDMVDEMVRLDLAESDEVNDIVDEFLALPSVNYNTSTALNTEEFTLIEWVKQQRTTRVVIGHLNLNVDYSSKIVTRPGHVGDMDLSDSTPLWCVFEKLFVAEFNGLTPDAVDHILRQDDSYCTPENRRQIVSNLRGKMLNLAVDISNPQTKGSNKRYTIIEKLA